VLTLIGQLGAHNVLDATDMIVMPMRQYNGSNGGLLLFQNTIQMLNVLWHILIASVD